MATLTCSMNEEDLNVFENLTEAEANDLADVLLSSCNSSISWTHPSPTEWEGDGDRVIEITGL